MAAAGLTVITRVTHYQCVFFTRVENIEVLELAQFHDNELRLRFPFLFPLFLFAEHLVTFLLVILVLVLLVLPRSLILLLLHQFLPLLAVLLLLVLELL